MKMNLSLKRVLSFLLVAVMVIGMCPVIAFAATDVTLTFKSGTTQDGEGRYLLYFEGLADTADKYWNNNTIYIDGKEVSGDGVHYLHLGSDFALLLYYSAIEENVTAASGFSGAHTLQIKSGTSLANGEYTVSNDVWLKLNGYEVTQLTPVNLSYASGGAQDWGTRFALTFSGFADTADKYWNNNTVYIDGKAVSGDGVHYLPDSGDNITLYLYYSAITANAATADALGAHTLEIPAGTLLGNYVVAKSLCFQINGSSITQVYTPDITVTLNDDWRNDSGCTDGVWFTTSEADALAYDTANWTTKYSMTTGGIYVNDTLVSGAKLVKVTDTLYYTAFDGCGITFAAGDIVKIAGTVTADGYTVAYTETSFQYDGNGAWDIYVAPAGNKFALDESDPGGWQGGESRYLVWLTDDISGDKTELGTVQLLIDGVSQNVPTALIGGRYALLLNADCGVAALGEHSVQITAGQALGEYTAASDAVFYTHADGSVNTTAPKYVTLGVNGGAWQTDLSRYLIWLTDDITDTKAEVGSISVIVNGESTTASTALIDGQYALLLNASNGITAMGEHSIQFTAGQSFGSYVVKNDLTIYTHNDSSINTTAPKYVTLGVNGGAWQADLSRYMIWLTDDITDTKAEVGSISVIVNGESTTASTVLIDGQYALLLNASNGITAMGEHSIQFTAGQKFGSYLVKNDLTIYTHNDSSINTTAPKYVTLGVNGGAWQADLSRYLIWLTDDITDTKAEVGSISVIVNGESTTASTALIDGQYALLLNASNGITAMGEHSIQFTAGQSFGIYLVKNDLAIYTHNDSSINTTAPVYVTLGLSDGGWQGEKNRYLVWLSDDISGDKANVTNVTALVDGESMAVPVALIDGRYALVLNESCGISALGEHSIQITTGQNFGSYIVNDDLTIYTHGDSSVNTTAPQYVTLGLEGGGWQGENNRYLVWLTDDISGDKPTISSITAEVNGESKTVPVALINGKYALVLDSSCGISELNENYVQITAGQYFGSYIVLSDLTIYTHEDGSVDAKEPTVEVPTDRIVNLTAKDENGQTVMNRGVAWTADGIAVAEQELKDSVVDGKVLLGYVYGGALYASIADINTEELNELEITLNTLDFAVHSELRHGSDLADSGLRFVAALSDPSYTKILLVADSNDKLNTENADYKVGDGISAAFKQIIAMDGAACYSIALTNIPAADYNKTYYAAGAILVTYADGTQSYVYTDAVASTVNEAAQKSAIASDSKTAYVDGVIHLNAKANLIGSYSYTAEVSNNANGDYVITYTGAQKVEALTIAYQRFTAADGVVFGDGVITIPVALFANAMLQEELAGTNNKLQIGAYRGPAIGLHTYTDSDGVVTDYSITRTHDEVYADLEDFFAAGFNIWMAEEWIYGASSFGDNDALSALDLAAEYCINHGLIGEDIQVLITDSLLNGLLEGYTMPENAGSTVAEYAAIIAERFDVLKNYNPKVNGVEVGTEYNCFAGYILRDEPHYDHLDYYNGWFSFLGADTDQSISVIANSASTGGQVSGTVNALGMLKEGYTLYFSMMGNGAAKKYIVSGSTSEDPCTTEEFTAYLRKFVDGVNSTVWNYSNMILTTDCYGLDTDVSSSFGSTSVTSENKMSEYWQENLALVASLVEEKNPNATFATVLRSFGMTRLYLMARASTWYYSENWTEFKKFDTAWGQQAMDLQAYTSLAHGYTYLSYFTYWETQNQSYKGETFTDACVMWDDNMNPVKQNMYYWVKNTNAEIRAMENLIGSFSYSGTAAVASGSSYYCGTDGLWSADQLAGNTAIASVTATADTTVGHYTKDGGNFSEMFILVNMSHPEDGSSDTVTVAFDSGYTSAIVYIDGEATLYQLSGGVCTVTIPSGEGIVVIPVA